MRTLIPLIGVLAAGACLAAPPVDEREAVLAAVQSLIDGWREADVAKLEAVLHPEFREVSMRLRGDKWETAVVDRARLIGLMAKIPKGAWDDRLVAPQVHVDGTIAVVWSSYRFTMHFVENGVAQSPVHCGVETFQLYRNEGIWKIVNFADTHLDSCPG